MKNIEMSFTVSVALQQTDVHWLEAELLRLREQVFLTLFERAIRRVEAAHLRRVGPCSVCGGPCVRNGRVLRQLQTLLGALVFQRTRLRCQHCGAERFPLDEALGLVPRMQQTLGVRERALWAATEVSDAKSEAFLAKFTGLAVSRGTIPAMAREEGEHLVAQDAAERRAVFEQGQRPPRAERQPRMLVIQVDGTGVHNRATGRSMESKVGVVFSERAQVSANRIELLDKRVVASLEPAAAFGEALWVAAQRQGVEQAEHVVLLSDGASWIKEVQALHFPQALVVLDLWHLEQSLRRTLGAEHPAIPALLAAARTGQVESVLAQVQALRPHMTTVEAVAQFDTLLGYLRANAEGIRNLPRAPIWGSGAVEKQVDVVVCRRLKTRGMSWYRRGAAALQRLLVLKLNGDWDRYWAARRHELARMAA